MYQHYNMLGNNHTYINIHDLVADSNGLIKLLYTWIYIYKWLNSSKLTKKHRETVVCSRQIQGVPLKFLGQNRRIHYHVTIFDTKNAKPLLQLSPASLASMVFSFPSGICQWGQPEKMQ